MQATNEELQSANEELQSANEELQSTNEELETSKEELQSVNEELLTVNAELQAKIEQLSTAEGEMKALLDSIHIGVLFLDRNLGIKRFTPEAVDLFTLIPTDVGRPISDIRSNLKYGDLLADARKVLETLQNSEREVESVDGQWYWMRIMPTRSSENVIDGLVFTFTDISQAKQALEKVELQSIARKYAESIVNTVREPLLVLDEDLKVISANESFRKVFRVKDEVMKGRFIYDLIKWNIQP
jgi:two-component system CheB/CheR fusion protein